MAHHQDELWTAALPARDEACDAHGRNTGQTDRDSDPRGAVTERRKQGHTCPRPPCLPHSPLPRLLILNQEDAWALYGNSYQTPAETWHKSGEEVPAVRSSQGDRGLPGKRTEHPRVRGTCWTRGRSEWAGSAGSSDPVC